ncbi:outer membrane lipoprotein LolB [Candidatus Persebacteraceae bacterium Df01]|jgi:outer membrane biogenesis lipoprotein LolB|uniref:Outer-membrane lipoprotein LolB n=1 Tax=Candidatus Doriopsillibacter californiensis TaxID=2970740 RepID=A0ABT7QMR2_9GAMM|nr:outer membrane lipoprotein LolB [Candidatus Persebacteraceae bacterium Df01]
MQNTGRLFFVILLLMGIAGCAPQPPKLTVPTVQFKIVGMLTVVSAGKPTQRLRLVWQRQEGAHDVVEIKGPLGGTRARIEQDDGGATLRADGKVYEAINGEALAQRFLKVELPVRAFGYWLVGDAAPDAPAHIDYGDDGRMQSIVQHDWEVFYDVRDSQGRLVSLRARTNGIAVTLKINKWLALQ